MSQVVVITGASAGVGRATVRAFAARGARIGLVARNREALENAKAEVEARGGQAVVAVADVADPDAVERAAKLVEDTFGPIDVWINNAMASVLGPIMEVPPEEFRRVTEVTYLGVDSKGMLDIDELKDGVTDRTILITVMYANNETGVVFPVDEIAAIAREKGIAFHTDAVQAAGKVPLDMQKLNVDLLSISGHKLYGPKGMGALFARRGVRLVPLIHGGHHERNRRGGTENVAGIVGLGKACEIASRDMEREIAQLTRLRDRLEKGLIKRIEHVYVNGDRENRLPNTTNISFEFVEGESLLLNLDMKGIAASSGSACTSGSLEPSHVLMAMGMSHELSHGSVRFSLGRINTEEDVDYLIEEMPPIVDRMRSMSPLYAGAK